LHHLFSAPAAPASYSKPTIKTPAHLLSLLLLTGLSSATSAPTSPKAKTSTNGMTMIHQGLDMVKSGKTMLNKWKAGHYPRHKEDGPGHGPDENVLRG